MTEGLFSVKGIIMNRIVDGPLLPHRCKVQLIYPDEHGIISLVPGLLESRILIQPGCVYARVCAIPIGEPT